jgi:hypothetical protein
MQCWQFSSEHQMARWLRPRQTREAAAVGRLFVYLCTLRTATVTNDSGQAYLGSDMKLVKKPGGGVIRRQPVCAPRTKPRWSINLTQTPKKAKCA